jgi:DNA-directed RNA polymerase specialized sigma24 family protein
VTTTVDDDFREFVAARWPELESLALVVILDPGRARALTADALAGLSRQWQDTVDAGRPGEQARRAVLQAAVTAASPGVPRASAEPVSPADPVDAVDPVVAALVDAIRTAPPIERAVLAGSVLWGCGPDEVAHLLDRDRGTVAEHAAALETRLTAAHDAARAAAGQEPAPWSREHDVAEALDEILRGLSDPPDPAGLVADRATGLRRRTLVAGGVAVAALTGVGAVLVRRGSNEPPPSARSTVATLAPDDPRWGSVDRWPPRGPLAADPAVASLVARSADPRDRVLWAGDVGAQRVVLALTYTGNVEQDGTVSDVTYSEPFLRAYQGPRGLDPTRLRVTPLTTGGTIGTTEVVALTLPGGQERPQQSLLLVLARPTLSTASVSVNAVPLPSGSVQRAWSQLPLVAGISTSTLDTPLPLATRLRVGSWEVTPDSFTESYSTIAEGPTPSTSPEWAETHLSALTGIPVDALASEVFVDAEVPRGLFEWPPPPDAVPARLVSLLTTTPDGAVVRTSAYYSEDFVAPLEPAHLLTATTQRDPLVVWASDERVGVARFLVAAPGADRVQMISTSPDGYPVSKVVRTRGKDAVIVPVVNGADAGEYRVITKDAKGRVLFDGVPNPGRYLLDT